MLNVPEAPLLSRGHKAAASVLSYNLLVALMPIVSLFAIGAVGGYHLSGDLDAYLESATDLLGIPAVWFFVIPLYAVFLWLLPSLVTAITFRYLPVPPRRSGYEDLLFGVGVILAIALSVSLWFRGFAETVHLEFLVRGLRPADLEHGAVLHEGKLTGLFLITFPEVLVYPFGVRLADSALRTTFEQGVGSVVAEDGPEEPSKIRVLSEPSTGDRRPPQQSSGNEEPDRREGDRSGSAAGDESNHDTGPEFDWRSPPSLDLSDVGGLNEEKAILQRRVIKPVTSGDGGYDRFDVKTQNLLLYGPPGTGKSYLAEATAGELGCPWLDISGGELKSRALNESGNRVNRLFEEAQTLGEEYDVVVVFLDEIDTVLPDRFEGLMNTHMEDKKVVNEFLNHLDETGDHGILVIGATNRVDALDGAATRSGRFDIRLEIDLPTPTEVKEVLQAQITRGEWAHQFSDDELQMFVPALEGQTPAEIATYVENARLIAAEENARALAPRHLEQVLEETHASQ